MNEKSTEYSLTAHNICNSKEAVVGHRNFYFTDTGKANLTLAVPDGFQLKKIKQTKTTVHYEATGKDFKNNHHEETDTLKNLSEKEGATLTVYLEIIPSGKDCEQLGILSEKKKQSIVVGSPLVNVKSEVVDTITYGKVKEYEENRDYSMCKSNKAVLNKSVHDTDSGTAYLYIPIPKGHSLKRLSKTENTLVYYTKGREISEQYTIHKVVERNMSKIMSSKIYINVFMNYEIDNCGISIKTERKKQSVVVGSPR